jgi:hypothetical protein
MRKSAAVLLAVACASATSSDNLAWSQERPSGGGFTMILAAPEKLTRSAFSCNERATTTMYEKQGRTRFHASGAVSTQERKSIGSATLDEKKGIVRWITPADLQTGNIEGSSYEILFKGKDLIVGIEQPSNNTSSVVSIVMIDKATSRMIEVSGGILFTNGKPEAVAGLFAISQFFECQEGL